MSLIGLGARIPVPLGSDSGAGVVAGQGVIEGLAPFASAEERAAALAAAVRCMLGDGTRGIPRGDSVSGASAESGVAVGSRRRSRLRSYNSREQQGSAESVGGLLGLGGGGVTETEAGGTSRVRVDDFGGLGLESDEDEE